MSLTGRRAFASKLIKDSNVDIRHRLAKILASASSSSSNLTPNANNTIDCDDNRFVDRLKSSNCFQFTQSIDVTSPDINDSSDTHSPNLYSTNSFADLPDPIDYEDYIEKNSDKIDAKLRAILLIPSDDIRVDKYRPTSRTLNSSPPNFLDLNIANDPYIHCVNGSNLKSMIIIKKYEKKMCRDEFQRRRKENLKRLRRQDYEHSNGSRSFKDESASILESQTPQTIIMEQFSSKTTPRPQSLISQASTFQPPLASDEDDDFFEDETARNRCDDIDDDDDESSRTPKAHEMNNLIECTPFNLLSKNLLCNDQNNHLSYIDSDRPNDDRQLNQSSFFSNKTDSFGSSFDEIFEKNYDDFFQNLSIQYDIDFSDQNHPLFYLFPCQNYEEMIEYRAEIYPPCDVYRFNFLIKCLSLEMDLTIEPIFASLAVYDLKARKKLTENFYFDLNPDSTKDLLKSHIAYQDLSTLSKSAIFGLSQLNPDLYFVIKLEKVFQNEINDVLEAYVRPPEDQNKLDRLKSMAKNNCERLGQYRMHFAWAVFPLVDILLANTKCRSDSLNSNQSSDILQPRNSSNSLESLKRIANECTSNFSRKGSLERHLTLGSINGSNSSLERKSSITNEDLAILFGQFKPVTITSKLFYRHEADKFSDDDLYKFISEFRRSSLNTKRVRSFPCTLKLDVCSLPNESQLKSRVNSELVRLHPFPNEQATPVKEVLEFRDILMPHHEHRNLLFVYPKSVNFTSRQNSARNVTIKIQLMNSEDKFNALPIIFGKSSCPEYLSEAFTAINYHNRCPNFSEEFKIRLPSQINKQTHLFFTFIHVHTKPKNDVPLNEIVGHTWLPLWREDRLQTGTFNLPIVTEQPTPGYSFLTPNDPESLSNLKWIDNHKPIFVVHLDSYSSIFAQDAYVDRFFRITSSLECQNQINSLFHSANIFEEFNKAITGLMNSSLDSLMKFVHIILNRIIWLMIKPPSVLQNINQSHPNLSLSSLKSLKLILFETFVGLVNRLIKAQNGGTLPNGFEILKTFLQFQVIIPQPESIYNLNYNSQTRNEIVNDDSESNLFTKPLHEEIISQWLKSDEKIFNLLMVNSFFFLDLIFKSICITLSLQSNSDKLVNNKNLHKFIDKSLKNNISNLITLITSFTIKQINDELYFSPQHQHQSTLQSNQSFIDQSSDLKSVRRLENLNSSLAFFIRDLLSILERFYVFGLIKQYLTTMIASTINTDQEQSKRTSNKFNERLFKLRIDFLRIICGHEHFFALNIPFGTPLFTSLESTNNWQNGNQSGFSPSFSLAKEMLDTNLFPNLLFDQIRLFSELTEEYRRQHWLLGLVFCTLIESFTKTKYSIQTKSANILRSIQTSFDWDDRFKDSSIKHRIACLFLPLIGILIDVIEHLNDTCTKDNPFYSVLEVQKHRKNNSKASNRDEDSYGSTFIENSIALAIGSSQSFGDLYENSQPPNKKTSPMHNYRLGLSYQPINPEATRILLTCLLWTIGNVDRTIFLQYLNEFSNERLLVFLELIRICTREFENKSNKRDYMSSPKLAFRKPDDTIRLHGSSRKDFLRRKDYSQSFGPTDSSNDGKIRWKRDSSVSSVPSALELMKSIDEERLQADEHLSTMVNLIVLDAINFIFNLFRQRIKCVSNFGLSSSTKSMAKNFNLKNQYANDEFVVCSAFHSLLQIFSFRQSDRVLLAALDSQRALLHLFPEILFVEGLSEIDFCSDLCYLLLKHCASKSSTVRIQAPASIYLLLRQYYQSSTNYSRIKIQITMSLSQLVGTSLAFSEINIRNALNNVLRYALNDQTVRETSFPNQVQELVFNLIMILSDTMQMKEHEKDPEMLLDLMYRISKGYQNSPVLRVTWLENMAKKHADFGQHVEAAQCYVHAAALVSECLHKVNRRSYLPVSCAAFQKVCPNVFEESLSSKSEINLDKTIYFNEDVDSKKDVHSLKLLSESGLIALLEQSAKYFQISGMFEAVNEIYKLLIPIQEHHYRYKDLAKIHSTLHDIFIKIEQQEGKRAFAAYFRVGFYGTLFGGLNQKEFIYKERFLTKLPEIANRLETFYGNRFGQENVEVIKDSNLVDVSKLENNKGNELIELVGFSIFCRSPIAYIQITYVEPYFDHWEMESRRTCFEKNYNIKRFIYSTPFTMDGRAHGQLYEQCKRKTILSIENAFPYLKTRILVRNRSQHSLSPIEVAIEDVLKKTLELANAANQDPVDGKILQMVLQGCVGTTVNQGPAEIANVFLSEEPNIPSGHQRPSLQLKNNLRNVFKEFCARCGEALSKNRKLASGNEKQCEYHKELERNFYLFTERLAPLMDHTNHKHSVAMLRKTYINGFIIPSVIQSPSSNDDRSDVDNQSKTINGVWNHHRL